MYEVSRFLMNKKHVLYEVSKRWYTFYGDGIKDLGRAQNRSVGIGC